MKKWNDGFLLVWFKVLNDRDLISVIKLVYWNIIYKELSVLRIKYNEG